MYWENIGLVLVYTSQLFLSQMRVIWESILPGFPKNFQDFRTLPKIVEGVLTTSEHYQRLLKMFQ